MTALPATPRKKADTGYQIRRDLNDASTLEVIGESGPVRTRLSTVDHMMNAGSSVVPAVEGLFGRGEVVLLGGDPMDGKTNTVTELAVSVTRGEPWMGRPTGRCAVLIAELDESAATTARRLGRMVQLGEEGNDGLGLTWLEKPEPMVFMTDSETGKPRVPDDTGLGKQVSEVRAALASQGHELGLVVVDTISTGLAAKIGIGYDSDANYLHAVRDFAAAGGVAVLFLTHLRKAGDEDPFNRFEFTKGVLGSVDLVMVLDVPVGRGEKSQNGRLRMRGNALDGEAVVAVTNVKGFWRPADPAAAWTEPEPKACVRQVCEYVLTHGDLHGTMTDIAHAAGVNEPPQTLSRALRGNAAWLRRHGVNFYQDERRQHRGKWCAHLVRTVAVDLPPELDQARQTVEAVFPAAIIVETAR